MARVFAVVRQSDYKDGSLSLEEQTEKIAEWCTREGHTLVQVAREQDVSGQRALERRPGLSAAVDAIENGAADLIAVGYFDRLVRSMRTQAEVIERVEKALKRRKVKGSGLVALDVGNISHATAAQWLTSTFLGMVAEYLARSTGERVQASKVRAVNEGRPPFKVLPGLRKIADGTVEPDPDKADLILRAFELRAASPPATLESIADYLAENGVEVAVASVERMLRSRQYLGELHYGELQNLTAWDAIVPVPLFDRVQRIRSPRGRHSQSELLLARQGILRCGTCDARMSAGYGTSQGKRYAIYRCQARKRACSAGASIMAHVVDEAVLARTESVLADVRGHAAVHAELDALRVASEQASEALSGAVQAFDGLGDVEAVKAKLAALRADDEAATARYEDLRATVMPLETFRAEDLRGSEIVDQRRAVRIALARVTVAPGHGADRLAFSERGVDLAA